MAAATLVSLLALVLPASARAQWTEVPAEAWREPAHSDSGGGDAIILLDQSEHRHEGNVFRYDYFARARVFTSEGRDIGTVEIDYPHRRWKLSNMRARSVLPNGRFTEWSPTQLIETQLFRYAGEAQMRAVVLIPGVEPGCIVEWGYTLEGPASEFEGMSFRLANSVYTCKSVHTWWPWKMLPDQIARSWQARGIHKVFIQAECHPSCRKPERMTFTAHRLGGIQDELMAPPASEVAPEVTVYYGEETSLFHWSQWKRVFDTWQVELGKELGELDQVVDGIRARAPNADSALIECFRWIQEHVHSAEERPWRERFGGSRKPYPEGSKSIAEILGRSEARSFEINCLMVAMATRLGLVAAVGFVGDRRRGGFDREHRTFPPTNFVSVIELEKGALYLQPDSRFAPYGSIPWYLRGGSCLLSGKGNALFRRVPVTNRDPAVAGWFVRLSMDREGRIRGGVEGRLSGEEAATWRRRLWSEDPESWSRRIGEWLGSDEGLDLRLVASKIPAPPDSALVIRGEGRWPDLAAVGPERIGIPMSSLAPWRTKASFREGRRRFPVLFGDARREVVRITLELPQGARVQRLPDSREYANEIGNWKLSWARAGDAVVMERQLELSMAEVPPHQYPLVQAFFQRLHEAELGPLVIQRGR